MGAIACPYHSLLTAIRLEADMHKVFARDLVSALGGSNLSCVFDDQVSPTGTGQKGRIRNGFKIFGDPITTRTRIERR